MTFFAVLWFILIFVLIAGYFVLDGFDLGAGALYPFVAKNDKEKAIVRRSVGPVWDGNEVWLLTAGGALFAAFAPAYATTFSGFYLAIMLVLFGLIVRAVSLEFRAHDPQWGRAWDICFFVGSLLPALLFGVAVGNIYAGIPMNANGDYTGLPLIGLITPFTLLCGLLGLSIFLSQGATWISLKAPKPSAVRDRAAKLRL
ncbi:MAG: cytochrome d ubiquinol oxidase subunit II, partial [Raoultibacter sp.]